MDTFESQLNQLLKSAGFDKIIEENKDKLSEKDIQDIDDFKKTVIQNFSNIFLNVSQITNNKKK